VTYTWSAVAAVLVVVAVDVLLLRTKLVRRKAFWTSYAIVLVFQLVVNGLLTGLRVVRYDPARIIGWRVAYAPVEDLLFGFAMVTSTLILWVWAGRRSVHAAPTTRRARP
jgi:lycopene cyclase domain-containing protein